MGAAWRGRPQPPPLPAQRLTDWGEGSFFTFFTPPFPPLQSNLGGGNPALALCPLAGVASRCGVTGCGRRQVPLTSLPLSGLWAWETLALGAGKVGSAGEGRASRAGRPWAGSLPLIRRPSAASGPAAVVRPGPPRRPSLAGEGADRRKWYPGGRARAWRPGPQPAAPALTRGCPPWNQAG